MNDDDWGMFEDAALGTGSWDTALGHLATVTGSKRCQLIAFGSDQWLPFNWVTNLSDADMALFDSIDGHNPATNFRLRAEQATNDQISFERHYDHARLATGPTDYIECCEQTAMPYGCQTMLENDARGALGLALLRSRKDGRTTDAHRETFRRAARHVRSAARLQIALEQQGSSLIHGAVERLSAACIVFDGAGLVRAITPAAEAAIASFDHVSIVDRRLTVRDPQSVAQLDSARAIMKDPAAQAQISVNLRVGAGAADIIRVDLHRLKRRDWSFGFEPAFMLVIDAASRAAYQRQKQLDRFSFTPAETAIAQLLAEGRNRNDIARHRSVTVETLRGQLKIMYAKAGCRREAELVATLHRIAV
ncbi:helix-turn-helix transcriptional regulator [Sphingomonas sp. NBWT7]|uniref:helix-turn-helix transcriptional regulator n=1 Tax=Sphingomonas sp. NBWT7 TaxID=2596913 RepID=UPI00162AD2B3|nr:helix-turn-helix transcriptional regulator [Sphingomonas sp. NBWT7]